MTGRWRTALAGALLAALAMFYVMNQVTLDSDYSAFLPAGQSETRRAFMRELRDGVASRIMLIEVTGAPADALAESSRKLAGVLAANPHFRYVSNGSADFGQRELALLERHRYVLSDRLDDPAHFSQQSLRIALEERLEALAGSAGALDKPFLSTDPTAELRRVLTRLAPATAPRRLHGVWFDAAGTGALLLAETRSSGADLAGQELAVDALRDAFATTRSMTSMSLDYSSPGTMALASRSLIAADARTLSLASMVLVLAILAWAYRSLPVVLLCLMPAAAGLLAGVVIVNAIFGSVHGITLAFGATLLGEAVDYPSYLLAQVRPDVPVTMVRQRFGKVLRLAVLTTACGAISLLFSGFPGLVQLGVLTIVGVVVAGVVTWWILPHWVPAHWSPAVAPNYPQARSPTTPRIPVPGWARGAAVAGIVLLVIVGAWGKPWWDDDLAAMSPLPASYKARDIRLRDAIGAPDVRFAMVVDGPTRQAVLEESEVLRVLLSRWVAEEAIAAFDLVSDYLPSDTTQRRRRAALPSPESLRESLETASRDLPFRAHLFEPFVQAVAGARVASPLTADELKGSALGLKVESMLRNEEGRWYVVVPLSGVKDAAVLTTVIARDRPAHATLLDLRHEATSMMAAYRQQAVVSSAIGLVLIFGLLVVGLAGFRAACAVTVPVVLAVMTTGGVWVALGQPLNIFHYVAMLLTVGIGLNYTLVMRWGASSIHASGTWRTLVLVSATALATFGLLALSGTPVLRAIGETVCLGVLFCLAFGALLIGGALPGQGQK